MWIELNDVFVLFCYNSAPDNGQKLLALDLALANGVSISFIFFKTQLFIYNLHVTFSSQMLTSVRV